MNTLYLDIFSGISGDMFLAALIDLGVDPHRLEAELARLGFDGYHLHVSRGQKSGIAGVKFDVHLEEDHSHPAPEANHDHEHAGHAHPHDHGHAHDHSHPHPHSHPHTEVHTHGRTFGEIRQRISASPLSDWVKDKSIAVFSRLAEAEGKIHGKSPEEVHFHEVGAIDSIVDIVGACIGLELLGKPRVLAAPVTEGTGWIQCAHGRLPLPAPATLAVLAARGIAITQCEEPHELVTPTGAALLAEFAESFAPMRQFVAQRIGFGVGTRDNKTRPNILRVVLGDMTESAQPQSLDWETDTVAVLETNLDDITAEVLGFVFEKVLASGALDVFHTSIQMKKNRPGVLLTVLCAEADADRLTELLLRETTAFGIRRHTAERRKLRREFVSTPTPFGAVKVKIGRLNGLVVQAAPEYDDCKALAQKAGVPIRQVFESARLGAPPLCGGGIPTAAGSRIQSGIQEHTDSSAA